MFTQILTVNNGEKKGQLKKIVCRTLIKYEKKQQNLKMVNLAAHLIILSLNYIPTITLRVCGMNFSGPFFAIDYRQYRLVGAENLTSIRFSFLLAPGKIVFYR